MASHLPVPRASAAPPTPQEIERKLGSPSLPPPLPHSPTASAFSASLDSSAAHPFVLLERRGSVASRRTSMNSVPQDEESDDPSLASFAASGGAAPRSSPPSHPSSHHLQPPGPPRLQLPLQSISETDDALGGSDAEESDASSLGGAAARSPPAVHHRVELAPVRTSADSASSSTTGPGGSGAGGAGGLSDNVAVKSGYLMKKGERRKAWKKRWFVLRGGQLAMYKSDKEYRLLRLIPLTEIHAVAPIELKKHQNAFGIVTPRRTYYVKADSPDQVTSWCRLIERAKNEYAARATVNSVETPTGGISPAETPRQMSFSGPAGSRPLAPAGGTSTAAAAVPIPGSGGPNLYGMTVSAPSTSYASTASWSTSSASGWADERGGLGAPPNSVVTAAGQGFASGVLSAASSSPHSTTTAAEDWSAGLDARLAQLDLAPASSSSDGPFDAPPLAPTGTTALLGSSPLSPAVPAVGGGAGEAVPSRPPPALRRPSARSETLASVPESPSDPPAGGLAIPDAGRPVARVRERSTSSATRLSASPSAGLGAGFGSDGGGGASGASGFGALSSSEEDEPYPAAYGSASITDPASSSSQPVSPPAPPVPLPSAPLPTPQPHDPNKVILSGYLMKQGKRKNWRKRWFVLHSGMLMYSRSHMDTKHSRQIPLSSIVDAIEAPTQRTNDHHHHQFHHHHLGGGGGGGGGGVPTSPSLTGGPLSPLVGSPGASSSSGAAATSSSGTQRMGESSTPGAGTGSGTGGPTMPDHTFKIITPSRTFLVCAPSEEDEIKWLAALQCLVARRTAHALQPASSSSTGQASSPGSAAATTAGLSSPPLATSNRYPVPAAPVLETGGDPNSSAYPKISSPSAAAAAGRPTHGRHRSGTDAARQAVRDVERRFHPGPGGTGAGGLSVGADSPQTAGGAAA